MKYKALIAVLSMTVLTYSVSACGVPKQEHDKIVQALEQTNQEKTAMNEQIDQVNKEKETLVQELTQLQKENEELKAKIAKIPAPKTPQKPAAKK